MPGLSMMARPDTGIARHWVRAGFVGLLLVGLAGCAGSAPSVSSIQSVNGDLSGGYRISAGDKLKVTVFDEKSLTGEYGIGDGGELAMPLIDAINANGKNAEQLAQLIAEHLKDGGYVLVPRVSVEIMEHRPFFILGEVTKPGEYLYSTDLTLEQAVAKAGGFTPRANKGTVQIQRQNWPTARRVRLGGQSLKIAPGDTITVQVAFF